MRSRRFIQCDVFTSVPTKGNGLAVVVDGDDLTTEQMQSFAQWTNLAETTFLMQPTQEDADYKVRIFTPTREMPFAGHPTLGSCVAWLETGGIPKNPTIIKQECAIGIVEIARDGTHPAFVAPPTQIKAMRPEEETRIMEQLGLSADQVLETAELNNGPVWQVFELASAQDVLSVDSSKVRWPEFKTIGLIGRYDERCDKGHDADYEVRMLAPSSGMSEDPITGSLNAAIAFWFQGSGKLDKPILISQGSSIGRLGRVSLRPRGDGSILVGGEVQILIRGEVSL